MKSKALATATIFSILAIPSLSQAGLTNSRLIHEGILSIPGKANIKLEQRGGRSITLNKGMTEVITEKVSLGFSLLDPKLVIKQNGKSLILDIPYENYHTAETFTYLTKDSDLNYDLYLRRSAIVSVEVQKVEMQGCTYKEAGPVCGVDVNGSYNCVISLLDKPGSQKARNTYVDTKTTYKLTLGKAGIIQAEFSSTKVVVEKKKSMALESCHK